MSRKHYIAIAAMLRQHITGATSTAEAVTATVIAGNLAGYFAEDNPAFDSDRFLTACGLS